MTRYDHPVVSRPLACKLGFHSFVSLESARKAMSRFQRLFVVARLDGCRRCGAVYCTRLNNAVAGGGRFRSGYVDPDEIEAEAGPSADATGTVYEPVPADATPNGRDPRA